MERHLSWKALSRKAAAQREALRPPLTPEPVEPVPFHADAYIGMEMLRWQGQIQQAILANKNRIDGLCYPHATDIGPQDFLKKVNKALPQPFVAKDTTPAYEGLPSFAIEWVPQDWVKNR